MLELPIQELDNLLSCESCATEVNYSLLSLFRLLLSLSIEETGLLLCCPLMLALFLGSVSAVSLRMVKREFARTLLSLNEN